MANLMDVSDEERKKVFRKVFRQLDVNGNGRLGVDEVMTGAQLLNMNPTRADARKMLKMADKDGNGYITYQEFEVVMQEHLALLSFQEQELKMAFQKFDKDGNGYLDKQELDVVLKSLGEGLDEEEATEIFQLVDTDNDGKICINGNGYITYQEFEVVMQEHLALLSFQEQELKMAFQKFDKDGNGYLDKQELGVVLKSLGEGLDEEEATEIFQLVDTDNDGKICINEFVKALSVDPGMTI